jgi:predicted TPR repeat methyltransferase
MPFSSSLGKQNIVLWFEKNKNSISSILDIGAGSGTYPKLLKNIVPNAKWIGIEAWQPYLEKFSLEQQYDEIHNVDVRNFNWNPLSSKVSVTIAGDVLEHITKDEAVELVNTILDHSEHLIISIPVSYCPQDEFEGNPFEEHIKPDWSDEEMKDTFGHYIKEYQIFEKKNLKLGVYVLSK